MSERDLPSVGVVRLMPIALRMVGMTSGVRNVPLVEFDFVPGTENTIGTRWTDSCAPPWSP